MKRKLIIDNYTSGAGRLNAVFLYRGMFSCAIARIYPLDWYHKYLGYNFCPAVLSVGSICRVQGSYEV